MSAETFKKKLKLGDTYCQKHDMSVPTLTRGKRTCLRCLIEEINERAEERHEKRAISEEEKERARKVV